MGWRNTLPHDVAHCQPTDCADRESCLRAQAMVVDERAVVVMMDASTARDERWQTPDERCRYWTEIDDEADE